ncbi:MAG: anti-sigma factor [Phycisphaerae bacterium]
MISTNRKPSSVVVGVLSGACMMAGCAMDPTDTGGTDPSTNRTLEVSFSNLEPLGEGFVYEGWLIVDDAPVAAGRFSVNEDGEPVPSSFEVNDDDASAASMYVLTIEPDVDDDPAPSDTHILAGAFDGSEADLTVEHGAALGDDFTMAMGSFILDTPTTTEVAEDFDQGIWWLDPSGGPGASLELPELPAGWVYEGWVVGDDGPVTTGRFLSANEADADGAGATAGPDAEPRFPGQDFIDPPVSLIGYAAVISIEPEPDDSPAPFVLKPLVDMDIEDVGAGVLQDMANAADDFPTGTVTIN